MKWSGKSTLLKIIAERIKPTSGQIHYDDKINLNDCTSRSLYFSEPTKTMPELIKVNEFCYYTSQFYPKINIDEVRNVLKKFGVNQKKDSVLVYLPVLWLIYFPFYVIHKSALKAVYTGFSGTYTNSCRAKRITWFR